MAVPLHTVPRCGPLRRGRDPRYPTRRAVALRPALLAVHQPARWQAQRDLAALAGALAAAGATGCEAVPGAGAGFRIMPAAQAVVAPVFDHGRGRVAIGCIVLTPPGFLTEAEALAVIRAEFATVGITFGEVDIPLHGVAVRGWEWETAAESMQDAGTSRLVEAVRPFIADAYDPAAGIVVEFISEDDYLPLGGEAKYHGTSVGIEDYRALAKKLRSQIRWQARDRLHVGVFYEPAVYEDVWLSEPTPRTAGAARVAPESQPARVPSPVEQQESYRMRALAAEQDALRAQVRDFIDWLRAQGAL